MNARIEIGPDDRVADLVEKISDGETLTLVRDGIAVAELRSVPAAFGQPPLMTKERLERLYAMTASIPPTMQDGAALIRRMRDEDDQW